MTKVQAAICVDKLNAAVGEIKTVLGMIDTKDEQQLLAEALSDLTTVRATLMKTADGL